MRFIQNVAELKKLAGELRVRPDWHEPDESGLTLSVHIPMRDRVGSTILDAGEDDGGPELTTGSFNFDNAMLDETEAYVEILQHGLPVGRVNFAILFALACGWSGLE